MEVPGRKVERSQEQFEFVCQPCKEDHGSHLPAHGYCTDCEEYLCEVCYDSHLRPRPMRHHKLLDKSEMPKEVQNFKPKDECTEPCRIHKGKIIEYYCIQHDQLGCGPCMTTGHRSCDDAVLYIPDVSMGTADSEQCHKIRNKIESMKSETVEIAKEVKVNTEAIHEVSEDANHAVKAFRKEIRTFFDEMKKTLEEEIEQKRNENIKRMNSVSESCDTVADDLECLTSDIEQKVDAKRENQLFVTLKQAEKEISVHDEKLQQAKHNMKFDQFEFVPNETAVNMMKTLKTLGQIVIKEECKNLSASQDVETSLEDLQSSQNKTDDKSSTKDKSSTNPSNMQSIGTSPSNTQTSPQMRATCLAAEMTIQSNTTINIASPQDKKKSDITRITILSDGRLALADSGNKSIKILDQNYKTVSYVQLSAGPWSIAEVGRDEIAVTISDEMKIQFMSVSGRRGRHIVTKGKCYGLVQTQGKLIVTVGSWLSNQLLILDMNGFVIKCLYIGSPFTKLYYLVISLDHYTLYVSEFHSVTSLTLKGVVKANYRYNDLLTGLTVDRSGRVYLCGSDNILQLSQDFTKVQVLYKGEVSKPHAIAYCERGNKILISNNGGSEIKVFELK